MKKPIKAGNSGPALNGGRTVLSRCCLVPKYEGIGQHPLYIESPITLLPEKKSWILKIVDSLTNMK